MRPIGMADGSPGGSVLSRPPTSAPSDSSSLAYVRVRRLRYGELPFERRDTGFEGVGFPDQAGDALVPGVVGVHSHAAGRLAAIDQYAWSGRVEIKRDRRP